MALFAYLSALQSWILFKIDSMACDEGSLERAQEIGFGPLSRDVGRKVLARAGASEAD
jgi:hypothetical protein